MSQLRKIVVANENIGIKHVIRLRAYWLRGTGAVRRHVTLQICSKTSILPLPTGYRVSGMTIALWVSMIFESARYAQSILIVRCTRNREKRT